MRGPTAPMDWLTFTPLVNYTATTSPSLATMVVSPTGRRVWSW